MRVEHDTVYNIEQGGAVDVTRLVSDEPIGNGNAELLPDMTEEEVRQYERDEVQGWKKLKRAIGLN